MVLLDELRVTMSDYRKDLKELYEVLGIEKAQARYDALQKQVADPDFYSDLENSQKVLQEVKSLENRIEKYKKMEETLDDILTLIELTMEEGEEESNAELNEEADKFVKELESLKLASLLTGEYDSSNAILTFHAGAGGTEAQDWAEMLYRMYNRWAERHNFKAELLDYLDGDEAGLKSASIMISGDNAYGFLKSESGVYRRSTPPAAGIPLSRLWKSCRKSTTPWKWTFVRKTSKWTCSVPAVPADSTSIRPVPRYV